LDDKYNEINLIHIFLSQYIVLVQEYIQPILSHFDGMNMTYSDILQY